MADKLHLARVIKRAAEKEEKRTDRNLQSALGALIADALCPVQSMFADLDPFNESEKTSKLVETRSEQSTTGWMHDYAIDKYVKAMGTLFIGLCHPSACARTHTHHLCRGRADKTLLAAG
jgi:hypothetical protein